jgi:predicted acetyltransferase
MDGILIKVFESPTVEQSKEFKDFADSNWGVHLYTDPNEEENNFFDKPTMWVVGYVGGKIAGLLLVFTRDITFDELNIKMAGIGGVVTAVDRRRMGVMSKILEETMKVVLPKYKLDIALLCTDIEKLGGLYGKVGFVPIGRPYYFIDKNGIEKEEKDGMMASLGDEKMMERIIRSQSKIFVGRSNF